MPGPVHFFPTFCAWVLLFRIFFCSLGNLVAGFLAARWLVFAIGRSLFRQDVLPGGWTPLASRGRFLFVAILL